ncbi:MAG: amino acid adenylation domain-containing protein, partial [Gammaproteobacteria bacterium]|nr:amino acid adenylation domain-containing protein [Gammaproteobacteria bacterium]
MPVGILLPHDSSQLIAVLSILKAGAAFIPLDVEFPLARITNIIADANVNVMILSGNDKDRINSLDVKGVNIIDINHYPQENNVDQFPTITPEKTAYIMYTSGTTGQPKGTIVSHAALANFVEWLCAEFTNGEYDYTLYSTSLCFDISMIEIFLPLCKNATIIVAENLLVMNELSSKDKITFINTVPSLVAELMKKDSALPAQLKLLTLMGEPLNVELTQKIYANADSLRIINGYGPTEATILTTYYHVSKDEQRIAIGKPVNNCNVLILDGNQNFTPIGGVGELYIGGKGLADGYLNREMLNEALFIDVKDFDGALKRYYKSGDRVRYRADGYLEYVGRLDAQVKISGIRIELPEIENVLSAIDNVDSSAVVLAPHDEKKLYAFVVTEMNIDESAIKKHLMTILPTYMIPHRIMAIKSLPYLISGKIDRLALQNLISVDDKSQQKNSDSSLTMNKGETEIANLFKELLNIKAVYNNDNFFELGGNSLIVVELISRLRKLFGIKLSFRDFYQTPTPSGIFASIQCLIEDEKRKK